MCSHSDTDGRRTNWKLWLIICTLKTQLQELFWGSASCSRTLWLVGRGVGAQRHRLICGRDPSLQVCWERAWFPRLDVPTHLRWTCSSTADLRTRSAGPREKFRASRASSFETLLWITYHPLPPGDRVHWSSQGVSGIAWHFKGRFVFPCFHLRWRVVFVSLSALCTNKLYFTDRTSVSVCTAVPGSCLHRYLTTGLGLYTQPSNHRSNHYMDRLWHPHMNPIRHKSG